ncbi:MAG: hypothetical protein KF734_13785 [Saprospiraceae bacterium]|nr:hypothetical protein [Saprospiraceae bacterium]
MLDSNGTVLDTWLGPHDPDLIVVRGVLPASDGGFIAHGRTYWGEGQWGSKVQETLLKFDSTLSPNGSSTSARAAATTTASTT